MKRMYAWLLLALALAWQTSGLPAAAVKPGTGAQADLTFFVVSDTHYGLSTNGDAAIPKLVDSMNALPGTAYPDKIGGKVGMPVGVIHIGDATTDGKEKSWKMFERDYGLTGKDGRLKWPVYETYGNHDGGPKSIVREHIKDRNKKRVGVTNISDNGAQYSWDWDGIHFVMLGISPGTTKNPYDPEQSTAFAKKDLEKNVGTSGRPVIMLHHFGFDKEHSWGWWPDEWKNEYYDVIKNYNVIAIIHGHMHKSAIYQWQGLDIYHPPHFAEDVKKGWPVKHGYFVFHITRDELTVAERKLDGTWGMTAKKAIGSKTK